MKQAGWQRVWRRVRVIALLAASSLVALSLATPSLATHLVVVTVVLSATFAPDATAQVYKWVDANGVTHYSERPQGNAKAKPLELRDASPQAPGAAKPAAQSNLQSQEIEYRKRQVMRAEEETRNAKVKAQRDESCRNARAQLVNMRASGGFYRLNDAGERVYMSDAERDASLAKREAEFKANCE